MASVFVLALAALCVRFGFWQLDRLDQRQARNAVLLERSRAAPIPLAALSGDTAGIFYRRVLVEGSFDHDHTMILAARSLRGVPGVYVFTPVRASAGRNSILINRGWLPAADGATVNTDSLRSAGPARLTAIALPLPAAPGRTAIADDSFRILRYALYADALQRQLPYHVLPFQLQALPEPGPQTGFPIRLHPPAVDQGPHLGYAIQWFSFAIIGIGGWLALVLRRRQKK